MIPMPQGEFKKLEILPLVCGRCGIEHLAKTTSWYLLQGFADNFINAEYDKPFCRKCDKWEIGEEKNEQAER